MPAAAILNFCKSVMLCYSSPDMVNVYQLTKFETNNFIHDRYMAKNPYLRIGPLPS